jgi:DNA-binding winged helix-turn-helix (wHTH) protein
MLTINPYNSREAVKDPAAFQGRRGLAAKIVRSLSQNNYNITGEPQAGKSSLLQFLAHPEGAFHTLAPPPQRERWLRLLIDLKRLPATTDFTFWRYLLDLLTITCKERDVETAVMREAYEEAKVTRDIYDIDLAVDKYIAGLDRNVVLLLDNFEVVVNYFPQKDALSTTGKLRSRNQDKIGNNRFCYIVTSNDPVYELFERQGLPRVEASSFCSGLEYEYLESLDEESSLSLIEAPLRDCPDGSLVFTENEKGWVLRLAGGHPALLKRTCYHLFEAKLRGGADFDILRETLRHDRAVLDNLKVLWGRLEETELKTNLKLKDSLAALAVDAEVSDGEALRELIQRGVVAEVDGAPRITAGVLADFIKSMTGEPAGSPKPPTVETPPLVVGTGEGKRTITFRGKKVSLSTLELKLLQHLAENRNRPCTRRELAEALWGQSPPDTSGKDALEHLIRRVRKKIEADYKNPRWILSIRKRGYLLHDDKTEPPYDIAASAPNFLPR